MDTYKFYGQKLKSVLPRQILNPAVSEESDLSFESDKTVVLNDNKLDCELTDSEPEIELDADLELETEFDDSFLENNDQLFPIANIAPIQKTSAIETKLKSKKSKPLEWKIKEPCNISVKKIPFTGIPTLGILPVRQPIEYFRDIISYDLIMRIVEESNIYAVQFDITKPLNLSSEELEVFIGILFLMSIVKMPGTCEYWDIFLQYERIANVMNIQRFERIKRFLHCNNNLNMSENCPDKLFKIRPLIDALKECFKLFVPAEMLCIDEQVVPFKGRSRLKQYNPKKPKKWGYKLYILTNPEGLIYAFEIHTGSISACTGQSDLKASGNIVMQLLQNIPRHNGHKLFIDNWYTGVELATALFNQGIALVGTVRPNRITDCKMPTDKYMKNKGRGSVEIKICQNNGVELRAIKWFDNRSVNILTTYESVVPIT